MLQHFPEPTHALDELARLLKPDGKLILTPPFASFVHMALYHYCGGFSRYWYEYHLPLHGFRIEEVTPNRDWFAYAEQELMRLGSMERQRGNWSWPLVYVFSLLWVLYFKLSGNKRADDLVFLDVGW